MHEPRRLKWASMLSFKASSPANLVYVRNAYGCIRGWRYTKVYGRYTNVYGRYRVSLGPAFVVFC